MIKYIPGTDLWLYPQVAQSMFRDRALQFADRLQWDVDVDRRGFERDQYDGLNPVYVIVEDEDGSHAGSLRLLPTTGPTMINARFGSALPGGAVRDPATWECTRFCLSTYAEPRTAARLFASAACLMGEFGITSLVAVFDQAMLRKYRVSGAPPEILGTTTVDGIDLMTGRWDFERRHLNDLMRRALLDPVMCELALANSSLLQHRAFFSA